MVEKNGQLVMLILDPWECHYLLTMLEDNMYTINQPNRHLTKHVYEKLTEQFHGTPIQFLTPESSIGEARMTKEAKKQALDSGAKKALEQRGIRGLIDRLRLWFTRRTTKGDV